MVTKGPEISYLKNELEDIADDVSVRQHDNHPMYSKPRKYKTVTATFYESEEIPDEFFSLLDSVRDSLIPRSVAKNNFDGGVIFWSDIIEETEYEFSFVTREALDVYR